MLGQALAFAWAERAAGHLALELGECVSASPDVPSLHRRAGALAPLLQARCGAGNTLLTRACSEA